MKKSRSRYRWVLAKRGQIDRHGGQPAYNANALATKKRKTKKAKPPEIVSGGLP